MHEVREEARHIRFSREYFAKADSITKAATTTPSLSATEKTDAEEEEEFRRVLEEFDGDVDKLLKSLDLDGSSQESSQVYEDLPSSPDDDISPEDFDLDEKNEIMRILETQDADRLEPEEFSPPPFVLKDTRRVNGDVTNDLVQLIDGGEDESSTKTLANTDDNLLSDEKIDELWDMIEFGTKFEYRPTSHSCNLAIGRPPKPDYSLHYRVRQENNISKAHIMYAY